MSGVPRARNAPRAAEGTVPRGQVAVVGPAERCGAPATPVAASAWQGPGASRQAAPGGALTAAAWFCWGCRQRYRPGLAFRAGTASCGVFGVFLRLETEVLSGVLLRVSSRGFRLKGSLSHWSVGKHSCDSPFLLGKEFIGSLEFNLLTFFLEILFVGPSPPTETLLYI